MAASNPFSVPGEALEVTKRIGMEAYDNIQQVVENLDDIKTAAEMQGDFDTQITAAVDHIDGVASDINDKATVIDGQADQVAADAAAVADLKIETEEARDAALATAVLWHTYFPNSREFVPQGLTTLTLTNAGGGGTDGTYKLGFAGGNFSIDPSATFTVDGGVVTEINMTGPGLYSGDTPVAPTPVFSASVGLSNVETNTVASYLVGSGENYLTDSLTDPLFVSLFVNNNGTPELVEEELAWASAGTSRLWAESDEAPDGASAKSSKTWASLSEAAAETAGNSAASAAAIGKFFLTLDEALIGTSVGEMFTTTDTDVILSGGGTNVDGYLRACIRISTLPYYAHLGAGADPATKIDIDTRVPSDSLRYYFIEDFGDVETDFAGALGSVLAYAAANNGWAVLKAGYTYTANTETIITDKHIRIMHNGAKIVRSASMLAAETILRIIHSYSTPIAVSSVTLGTADVGSGGVGNVATFTVADSTGWAAGQIGRVVSDEGIGHTNSGERQADDFLVLSVTATTITTTTPLNYTYTTNVRIARRSEYTVDIRDPWFEDDAAAPFHGQGALQILGATRPRIYNPVMLNLKGTAIWLRSCYNDMVSGGYFSRISSSGLGSIGPAAPGYGIFNYGCTGSVHTGNRGDRLRHLHTTGGKDGLTDNDADFAGYGGCSNWLVSNCHAVNPEDEGFSSHPEAYMGTYLACSVRNAPHGCMTLRGKAITAKDCVTDGPTGVTINTYGDALTTGGTDMAIIGHKHHRNSRQTISGGPLIVSHLGTNRARVYVDMVVDQKASAGVANSISNVELSGRIASRWDFIGTGQQRFISVVNSIVKLERLEVDFSRSTGTNTPRISYFTDELSEIQIDDFRVTAGAIPWNIAQFANSGGAATIMVENLSSDLACAGANGASGSNVWGINERVRGGRTIQPATFIVNGAASTTDLAVALTGRAEPLITYNYTSSGTANNRNVSFTTAPLTGLQQLQVTNNAASTKTLTITTVTSMPLASSIVLKPGQTACFTSYYDTTSSAFIWRFMGVIGCFNNTKGSSAVATDASGDVIVTHGLGVIPSVVHIQATGTTTRLYSVTTKTLTTFTVRAKDITNAAVVSTAVTFDWTASQ